MPYPVFAPLQSSDVLGTLGILIGIGVLFAVVIGLDFLMAESMLSGGESADRASQTNCPECGARNTDGRDRCRHCGEGLASRG